MTLLCSQDLCIGPCYEPYESTPHPHILWDTFQYYTVIDILVAVLVLMLRTVLVVEGMPEI